MKEDLMSGDAGRETARVQEAYERRTRRGPDAAYDPWEPSNLFLPSPASVHS
jgi:hypothetical protein